MLKFVFLSIFLGFLVTVCDVNSKAVSFKTHQASSIRFDGKNGQVLRPLVKSRRAGGDGGAEFDDMVMFRHANITGIHSISISSGEYIDSLEVVYTLSNKSLLRTPKRGISSRPAVNLTFADQDEFVTKLEGKTGNNQVAQLTITSKGPKATTVHGPFGRSGKQSFSYSGQIIALHGRSGDSLDSIGVYGLKSLSKSIQYGEDLGTDFDDYADSGFLPIVKIRSISVWTGMFIEAFQVDYLLLDGSNVSTQRHGFQYSTNLTTIVFAEDEKITSLRGKLEINLQTARKYIGQLSFETIRSNGDSKVYGPYGLWGRDEDSFNVQGNILGFHGGSGSLLYRIGAYFI